MQEQNKIDVLTAFFQAASNDVRLTHTHISIYFALFRSYIINDCQNPIRITRSEVMAYSKVSIATYHKCISELNAFGYIKYIPSYHPSNGSNVYLYIV